MCLQSLCTTLHTVHVVLIMRMTILAHSPAMASSTWLKLIQTKPLLVPTPTHGY